MAKGECFKNILFIINKYTIIFWIFKYGNRINVKTITLEIIILNCARNFFEWIQSEKSDNNDFKEKCESGGQIMTKAMIICGADTKE